MNRICEKCIYWERKRGFDFTNYYGNCHRYPKIEIKSEDDWCGEYMKKIIDKQLKKLW